MARDEVSGEADRGHAAVPDPHGLDLFAADPDLEPLVRLHCGGVLAGRLIPQLRDLGRLAGGRLDALASEADRYPPTLSHRHRTGEDVQTIAKHPAYQEMERIAFADLGLASMSHRGALGDGMAARPIEKHLLTYLFAQAEFGLLCPVSMTDSLARTLRRFGDPALVGRFLPGLAARDIDALLQGAMFMTEREAGSDVGATRVRADPAEDGTWRLHGDKWFCSNPDADLAMVLARIPDGPPGIRGVALFLVPRLRPDGSRNALRIVQLKDKLGSRSMASGEVRLEGTLAWLVGDPSAGFRQMADMVNNSRLSNGVRAAGLMRRAATEALFFARHREAFGGRVMDKPLMRRQLAKILLPAEQARAMMFLAADALERADGGDLGAYALTRILTPLFKFRACRDARRVTGDAMEVRGGCGYVEEFPDPRLLRDAHLGSIWEGTSNIVALDVLRAIRREGSLDALADRLDVLAGDEPEGLAERRAAALALAGRVAAEGDERAARTAASALYHAATATVMAWEGRQLGSPRREALARLVLRHRLGPRDPLEPSHSDEAALEDAVIGQAA
jgi:alkylation response protein AidB-like acyl-CoA dehydrogenase